MSCFIHLFRLSKKALLTVTMVFSAFCLFLESLAFAVDSTSKSLQPFFHNGTYDTRIPKPDDLLGFPLGSEPANYQLMTQYLLALDQSSSRAKLVEYGKTYEGRSLYYLIVTSEENNRRLEQIQGSIARLASPAKGMRQPDANELIANTPAVAWLGYSIHGDELSSTDAALQVAYQLAAGTDSLTNAILDELVVCIDPLQNPDGRERFVNQMQQWRGVVPNPDVQSMHHTGTWPWGRGNHYLFDMNRDYLPMVREETRSRMREIREWNPQLLIDSHEMGSLDTYLFSPPREPYSPNISSYHHKWWKIFSLDQARAFDAYGWRYYTRDWNEMWYPGYADSWVLYSGAIGILYEQAGVEGSMVKQLDSSLMEYRETVHHHFVSSMTNLATAAGHRQELLQDFYQERTRAAEAYKSDPVKLFIIDPGDNQFLARRLISRLLQLGIEVQMADEDFVLPEARDYWGSRPANKRFSKGTFIILTEQQQNPLLHAFLDFDPRMSTSFLQSERRELEKFNRTRIYDVTGWSLPMAYAVDAYFSRQAPKSKMYLLSSLGDNSGLVENPDAQYAYIIDYAQDGAPFALARMLEQGYTIHAAEKPFKLQGKTFARGSLVLFREKNPSGLKSDLEDAVRTWGINVVGVNTGLSEEGSDLGSERFRLLSKPKITVLGNAPVYPSGFGEIWYLLDEELKMRYSILDAARLSNADLAVYNVLIIPSVYQSPQELQSSFGKGGMEKLRRWIESGGALIAIGSSAAFAADTSSKLSQVRLRHQVLDKLEVYKAALTLSSQAENPKVDSLSLWNIKPGSTDAAAPPMQKKDVPAGIPDKKEMQEWDSWLQRFSPQGTIVRADLDEEHWLSFGLSPKVPVLLATANVFLAKEPVKIAGRLADRDSLRLSGLLWPEARDRCANTAFVTQEKLGKGQIILFADDPYFRAYFYGSVKLLLNAILLGPGFGTEATLPW